MLENDKKKYNKINQQNEVVNFFLSEKNII